MSEQFVKVSGIDLLCMAREALEQGNSERGEQLTAMVVDGMRQFAKQGRADQAIACELMLYRIVVKYRETEESVERYFSMWRDTLYSLGKKERNESAWSDGDGVGMVFQTLYPLANVETAYNTLKISSPCHIYVIGSYNESVREKFEGLGCKVTCLLDYIEDDVNIVDRMKMLRSCMSFDGVGIAVWVSTPSCASYAFGLGLARHQVMWAHRYHAHIPGADLYVCYGDNDTRTYHGHRWAAVRQPLIDWQAVRESPREEKSGAFSFGTIARHEKMEEPEFLSAVSEILKACPEAHYEFCGKYTPDSVREHFNREGVWDRCHFHGWVNAQAFVTRLDAFLETFPLGGICGLYAVARDVPVVAMRTEWNPLAHAGYPVAENKDQFIDDAIKLHRDCGYRQARIEDGRKLVERETALARAGARRFQDLLTTMQLSAADA